MKKKIKYLVIVLTLSILVYYCGPLLILSLINREIGGCMSESISESKQRKVFICEYKIPNNVIVVPGVDTFHVESVWLEELWRSEYSYPEITHRFTKDVNYKIIIKLKETEIYKTLNEQWQIEKERDTLKNGKEQPYYFHGGAKKWIFSYPLFYLPMDSVFIWDIKSGKFSAQPDSITGSKKIGEIRLIRQ